MALTAMLAGCATMDAGECRRADWRAVGLRDGLAGESLSMMERRTEDCAEHKLTVNTPLYLEGRNQGLMQYCRIDQAARLGLEGKPYHGVCAPGIDGEFRRRHALGHDLRQARSALDSLYSRQRSLEAKLDKAKADDERHRWRKELRELDPDIRRARERVRTAEWNFDRLQ